jgi:hypothetical protein
MQFIVAFFVGLGVAAWLYNRTMKSSGSNTKNSLIIGGVAGGIAFIVIFTLAQMFLGS